MPSNSTSTIGFTLIELMIVIAITAIIVAGSYGIIGFNFKSQSELELTAREIVSVLRNAQDRSMSQEDSVRWGVYFENTDKDNGFYVLYKGVTTTIVSKKNLRSNIEFFDPSISSSRDVEFSSMTGMPASAVNIIFNLKNNPSILTTITINSNGQIQYK